MNILSLTSYDRFRLDDYLDQDDTASPAAIGSNIQVGAFKSRMFTQELRLLSPGEDAFRYALGVYYANTGFDRPFQRGPGLLARQLVCHHRIAAGRRLRPDRLGIRAEADRHRRRSYPRTSASNTPSPTIWRGPAMPGMPTIPPPPTIWA